MRTKFLEPFTLRVSVASIAAFVALVSLNACGSETPATSAPQAPTKSSAPAEEKTEAPKPDKTNPTKVKPPVADKLVKDPNCPGGWHTQEMMNPSPEQPQADAVSDLAFVGVGSTSKGPNCYDTISFMVGKKNPTYHATYDGTVLRLKLGAPPTPAFNKPAGTVLTAKETDGTPKSVKQVRFGSSDSKSTTLELETSGQPFRVGRGFGVGPNQGVMFVFVHVKHNA